MPCWANVRALTILSLLIYQAFAQNRPAAPKMHLLGLTETDTGPEAQAERNKILVTRWAEAVWKRDLGSAQPLVTDDCVIHAGASTYSQGPEALKRWLADADPNWSYGGSTTDWRLAP